MRNIRHFHFNNVYRGFSQYLRRLYFHRQFFAYAGRFYVSQKYLSWVSTGRVTFGKSKILLYVSLNVQYSSVLCMLVDRSEALFILNR